MQKHYVHIENIKMICERLLDVKVEHISTWNCCI